MTYLSEIIPPARLKEYNEKVQAMAAQLKKLSWLDRYSIPRRLIIWRFERKFLNLTKRLTHGFKHS